MRNTSPHPAPPFFPLRWGLGPGKIHPFIPHLVSASIISVAVHSQLRADPARRPVWQLFPASSPPGRMSSLVPLFHICRWGSWPQPPPTPGELEGVAELIRQLANRF